MSSKKFCRGWRKLVTTLVVLLVAVLAWKLIFGPEKTWRDACGTTSGKILDEALCAYEMNPDGRVAADAGPTASPTAGPTDADKAAAKLLPAADDDYFADMDNGATKNPEQLARDLAPYVPGVSPEQARKAAVIGRNNWIVWTAGNDRFWDVLAGRSFGNLDLLKTISNAPNLQFNRDNRWNYLGLVNEPCFHKPSGPRADRYGLWLDERDADCPADPYENEAKYPGIKIGARGKNNLPVGSSYGYATGIVGLRLFPNPDFDEKAQARWDWYRYYNDPSYYTDKDLVRPYRVGMSCGFCHVGPSPTNPPANPNAPQWSNLNSNPGAQYFWVDRIFTWNADKTNYIHDLFNTSRPGALDTSLVSSDYINNPRTMNAVYSLGARMALAKAFGKESLKGPEQNNKQLNDYLPPDSPLNGFYSKPDTAWSPHVLKDGADSVGAVGALNRVYINIGLFGDEWITHFNPIVGGTGISPIDIAIGRRNSAYWVANENQTADLALFFLATAKPDLLSNAPGGQKYLSSDAGRIDRGKEIFAENCAACHSSKLPPRAYSFFPEDGCSGPDYLNCWNKYWRYARSDAFKAEMRQIAAKDDFTRDNFMSTDLRVPVTLLETQACSPLATNGIRNNIWDNFSASSYKDLPSVGSFTVHDPYTGAKAADITLPDGGRGYTRPASLISLWSTAPFLLNNSVGPFDPSPSVESRMKVFDASIEQMLWPEKRDGSIIYETRSGLKLPGKVDVLEKTAFISVPQSYLPFGAKTLLNWLTGYRYDDPNGLKLGPIPAGTPVNLIAGIDLDEPDGFLARIGRKFELIGLVLKLNSTFAKVEKASDPQEAKAIFRSIAPDLIANDKCQDYIVNRGHYFGTQYLSDPSGAPVVGLTDAQKTDLIAFLKTL